MKKWAACFRNLIFKGSLMRNHGYKVSTLSSLMTIYLQYNIRVHLQSMWQPNSKWDASKVTFLRFRVYNVFAFSSDDLNWSLTASVNNMVHHHHNILHTRHTSYQNCCVYKHFRIWPLAPHMNDDLQQNNLVHLYNMRYLRIKRFSRMPWLRGLWFSWKLKKYHKMNHGMSIYHLHDSRDWYAIFEVHTWDIVLRLCL